MSLSGRVQNTAPFSPLRYPFVGIGCLSFWFSLSNTVSSVKYLINSTWLSTLIHISHESSRISIVHCSYSLPVTASDPAPQLLERLQEQEQEQELRPKPKHSLLPTATIKIDLRSHGKDNMAPAPGSDHAEDNLSSPAMTSTKDRHQKEADPTTPPYSSYPPLPSAWNGVVPESLTPIPITTDTNGMVVIIVIDSHGKSLYQTSTKGTNRNVPSQSSTITTPFADSSPTPSHLMSTSLVTTSAAAPPTSSSGFETQPQDKSEHSGPPFPVVVAMGIIIPSILIILSLCGFYFCIMKKRKTHHDQEVSVMVAARRVPEMKDTGVGGGPNILGARAVAPMSASGAVVSPLTTPASASSAAPGTPPVILSTTMNDAYYTGIDTSDHISLTDQRSEASADTFGEEPPPPYRPRSVPPISRETSVRNSMCRNTSVRSTRHDPMSGSNLMRRSVDVRSPFDDPEDSDDDDNISQISTIRSLPVRDTDRLSVVSDMSYQEEPVHSHSGVR